MLAEIPDYFLDAVRKYTPNSPGIYVAQLLWQRGIKELEQLRAFMQPEFYQPASPWEFGVELDFALERIKQAILLCNAKAIANSEKITIWGDFDADGITSTTVLWSGLQEFLADDCGDHSASDRKSSLNYYIPNRFTESHGLNCPGIAKLAKAGTKLIITCDTGSTNITEIAYAQELGIDVIITDHHTLPPERPPVIAILNPRYFPADHQLANLSGVAVAYKLIEALYEFLPDLPQQPLTDLLDLVAIGLVADLVQLTGDCRYLAQLGIKQLPQTKRLGLKKLLNYCKKSGDRPTDISFGIAPRLNAISRIHEDPGVLVEFLTSTDQKRVDQLGEQVELANTRRKALEKDTIAQVKKQVALLDLSTTQVIILADSQWQVGILGLVAGRIAQEYGKPTILFHTEELPIAPLFEAATPNSEKINPIDNNFTALARGSARSFGGIDLYELVASQAHLLHNFGGHPFAAGLSLPVENIPIFTATINQQLRQKIGLSGNFNLINNSRNQPDLVVTVAELGLELYQELKLLEPCGMGNPAPKLLIKNCRFNSIRNANIYDIKSKKVAYLKTEFNLWDDTNKIGFPGVWWGHGRDELPQEIEEKDTLLQSNIHAIVKLDCNNHEKCTQVEIITIFNSTETNVEVSNNSYLSPQTNSAQILDYRSLNSPIPSLTPLTPCTSPYLPIPPSSSPLKITHIPLSWDELQKWFYQAQQEQRPLAIAYPPLSDLSPLEIWGQLLGISKYLSRTGEIVTPDKIQQKLGLSNQSLALGLRAIAAWGFKVNYLQELSEPLLLDDPNKYLEIDGQGEIKISWESNISPFSDSNTQNSPNINQFLNAVAEEQFRRQYFYQVSLKTMEAILQV